MFCQLSKKFSVNFRNYISMELDERNNSTKMWCNFGVTSDGQNMGLVLVEHVPSNRFTDVPFKKIIYCTDKDKSGK